MTLPKFDNLNDVTSKFVNTICYLKDEPVYVKAAFHDDKDNKKFILSVSPYAGESQLVDVHDPNFRYRDYNLGYCNHGTATWWYRRPARQYQQGLKPEQVRFYTETGLGQPKSNFGFVKPYVEMLRNKYFSFEEAAKLTRDGKMPVSAWHKDFALTWNGADSIIYLEYRASRIGVIDPNGEPQLYPEAEYLQEALQEALGR